MSGRRLRVLAPRLQFYMRGLGQHGLNKLPAVVPSTVPPFQPLIMRSCSAEEAIDAIPLAGPGAVQAVVPTAGGQVPHRFRAQMFPPFARGFEAQMLTAV